MVETVKSWVEAGLFFAVLLVFFGLVARSNVRAARVIGWFSIAWAFTVMLVEGYGWYGKGDWIILPARQFWHQIDRGSLNGVEFFMNQYFPAGLNALGEWVLDWPAWLVLGIIGVAFLAYDHVQVMNSMTGRRPPPLWKRLYTWVRQAVREQRAS